MIEMHSLKKNFKKIVPPIITDYITNQKRPPMKEFNSYQEAIQECKEGYEDPNLCYLIANKCHEYHKNLSATRRLDLNALKTIAAFGYSNLSPMLNAKKCKVLDFGGGGGAHFAIAKLLVKEGVKLDWSIIETPQLVKACQKEFSSNHEIHFFDSINEIIEKKEKFDFVFSSGALHYCENPIDYLKKLMQVNSKSIVITRTAFSETSQTYFTVQESLLSENGPGNLTSKFQDKLVKYPNVFMPFDEALRILKDNYRDVLVLEEEKNVYQSQNHQFSMYGFYGRNVSTVSAP